MLGANHYAKPTRGMASSLSSSPSSRLAAGLIASGLGVMLLAQYVGGVPIASALAVVAWGAVQLASSRPNRRALVAVNTAIYVSLVGFAIASQTHAAQSQHDSMGLLTLADHALAIVLLVGLVLHASKSAASTIEE